MTSSNFFLLNFVVLSRKKGTLLSHIPAIVGAVLSCLCVVAKAPELLMIGRVVTGFNCGEYSSTECSPILIHQIHYLSISVR